MIVLLALLLGVLVALLASSVGHGKAERRGYEFIAAEQRALQGLDPSSFAAIQLRQQIEAQVLVLNNGLVARSTRWRAAAMTLVWAGVVVGLAAWLWKRTGRTPMDWVVITFGIGYFATLTVRQLAVVFHRNRIASLASDDAEPSGSPAIA